MSAAGRVKRFYKDVAAVPHEERFAVLLDGRNVKTQSGAPLLARTQALADAIAEEWAAQGGHIERRTMPLTGLQSAAIDGAADSTIWVEEILNYLCTDLVCYRTDVPQELTERQAECWDPYISFLRQEFGAILVTTNGVTAVPQPDAAKTAIRSALKDQAPEVLFALQIATAIAGSAALALAMWRRVFEPNIVFDASRVDEHFQQQQWGVDNEAKVREDRLRSDFLTVARFLSLLES